MRGAWYRWKDGKLELRVRVQARSKQQGFAGIQGDAVRIKLRAPPVEGKANDQLVRFLADAFDVPTSRVQIIRGERDARKLMMIEAPRRIPPQLGPVYPPGQG